MKFKLVSSKKWKSKVKRYEAEDIVLLEEYRDNDLFAWEVSHKSNNQVQVGIVKEGFWDFIKTVDSVDPGNAKPYTYKKPPLGEINRDQIVIVAQANFELIYDIDFNLKTRCHDIAIPISRFDNEDEYKAFHENLKLTDEILHKGNLNEEGYFNVFICLEQDRYEQFMNSDNFYNSVVDYICSS